MLIDTHVHTTCSDGKKSVPEVFQLASALNIKLLAITDHDTIRAYPEAFEEAEKYGMTPISGVELSTKDEDGHRDVHVVGLKMDVADKKLARELDRLASARIDARKKLLENVNKYFMNRYSDWQPVKFEEVEKRALGRIIGKPHVAGAVHSQAQMLGIPVTEDDLYRIFKLPGVKTKKAYELTMEECISLVKKTGGVPVLAHSCEYPDMDAVVKKFAKLGGEAIELCKYRYKTKLSEIRSLSMAERLDLEMEMNIRTIKLGRKHGLKFTASSDYHAKTGEPGMDPAVYGIDVDWLFE